MRIVCGPSGFSFDQFEHDLGIVLYDRTDTLERGSVGKRIPVVLRRNRYAPDPVAWDLLAIALGVHAADLAAHRRDSSDGWTRTFELTVAVTDADRWQGTSHLWIQLLNFLTTDRWRISFIAGGKTPRAHAERRYATETSVVLLSGGLDSLIGAVDLVHGGERPLAVSQNVRGDGEKQLQFAAAIGGGLRHLQLSHTTYVPDAESPASQRSRSMLFLGYGILSATCTEKYRDDGTVPLYICENGFIALNPPLTENRVGSLSTRTTHPVVLSLLQQILSTVGLSVQLQNPYANKTKGEMLVECRDQQFIRESAPLSTSCGRFKQFGYKHCGRCVPCLVRRGAFLRWSVPDTTGYVFEDLGKDDPRFSGFDDVRSTLMAGVVCDEIGGRRWLGATLSSALITDKEELRDTALRGLDEVRAFLEDSDVS